jgi:hypothetical protein
LNLPSQSTEIEMGMGVDQGGQYTTLVALAYPGFRPLAAKQLEGSHFQNDTSGHRHRTISDGRPVYGQYNFGPV